MSRNIAEAIRAIQNASSLGDTNGKPWAAKALSILFVLSFGLFCFWLGERKRAPSVPTQSDYERAQYVAADSFKYIEIPEDVIPCIVRPGKGWVEGRAFRQGHVEPDGEVYFPIIPEMPSCPAMADGMLPMPPGATVADAPQRANQ